MKFLIHTPSLGMTGGSKSIIELSKALLYAGHNVDLLLDKKTISHVLPDSIRVFHLGKKVILLDKKSIPSKKKQRILKAKNIPSVCQFRKLRRWLKYFKLLMKFQRGNQIMKNFLAESDYDLVISNNMYHCLEHLFYYRGYNVALCLRNSPIEVFCSRTVPRFFSLKKYFENISLVGVSDETSNEMKSLVPSVSVSTIYNPFDIDGIRLLASEPIGSIYVNYLLIVGSLCLRKRVDIAIKAFARINQADLKLLIIGDGSEKVNLYKLTKSLSVEDKVIFLGQQSNPYKYMKNAKLSLLTSESEGLPRVLIESLICGTPTISTNCPTGPSEILYGDYSDLIVNIKNTDENNIIDTFKNKILKYLNVEMDLTGEIIERFDKKNCVEKWEYLARK